MEIIAQGAEATIYRNGSKIIKDRVSKAYRIKELDNAIRKKCTRMESRILQRASKLVNVPQLLNSDERSMRLEMEFIEGQKLRDLVKTLLPAERAKIFWQMGKDLAVLHNNYIIHGDLTTSNILVNKKVFFIDFGLSFISKKVEDMAVDLHLLERALHSKHYQYAEELYKEVLKGYKEASNDFGAIQERLKKVESRGRYKKRIEVRKKPLSFQRE